MLPESVHEVIVRAELLAYIAPPFASPPERSYANSYELYKIAVFPESVHEVILSVELPFKYIAPPSCTNGSTTKAAQTKRITPTTNQYTAPGALVRPAASGSVKEKVVL